MYFKIFFISICLSILGSCSSESKKEHEEFNGIADIEVDESVLPLIEEQTKIFKLHYPGTDFKIKVQPENRSIFRLMKDSVSLVAACREFNQDEKDILKSRGFEYQPGRMALDAVALIVHPSSPYSKLSITELKELFTKDDSKTSLLFDSGNSACLNTVIEKLKLDPKTLKNVYSANGHKDVFERVKSDPNLIGFVGYSWISDEDSQIHRKRKEGIRLLALEKPNTRAFFDLTYKNLEDRNYVLERFVIVYTLNAMWGIEKGFVRHACSKVGSLVTEKYGIVPFYKIPKEYNIVNGTKFVPVK
ncbi:MAG: PstS family phosphate ABC transporter substrate-binding protein [Leadbetterella sp.]